MKRRLRYDSLLSMATSVEGRQRAVNDRGAGGDAFSALVVQVLKLSGALAAAGDALAKPAGQTAARWQVLAVVEDAPATVAAIARTLAHTRQSVQRIADALVQDGLGRYVANPAHRRAKLLELAPAGLHALRTIQAAQAVWARRIAKDKEPEHLDRLRVALEDLERRLGEVSP